MTPTELKNLDDDSYGLLFDVRRSVRYHDKRAAFFERVHRLTNALAILLSGSVLFDLARPGDTPWWMSSLAVTAALLSAADMVMGLNKYGELHRSLQRRFAELERRMIIGSAQGACWVEYHSERLSIEMDEPTPYKMLDTLCHNELLRVQGFKRGSENYVSIGWWQRLTCQFWPWSDAFTHAC